MCILTKSLNKYKLGKLGYPNYENVGSFESKYFPISNLLTLFSNSITNCPSKPRTWSKNVSDGKIIPPKGSSFVSSYALNKHSECVLPFSAF
jgi:hypothetical protein